MEIQLPATPGVRKPGNVANREASIRKKVSLLTSEGIKLCSWLMCERQEIVLSRQVLKCLSFVNQLAEMTSKTEEKYFLSGYNKVQNEVKTVEFWLKHIQNMPYLSPEEYRSVSKKVYEMISIAASVSRVKIEEYLIRKAAPGDKVAGMERPGEIFSVIVNRKKTAKKANGEEIRVSGHKNKKRIYPGQSI